MVVMLFCMTGNAYSVQDKDIGTIIVQEQGYPVEGQIEKVFVIASAINTDAVVAEIITLNIEPVSGSPFVYSQFANNYSGTWLEFLYNT